MKATDKIYIYECRCYERLQAKTKEFTCLSYTELVLELEHLKIETRLITEMFANVMGECENEMLPDAMGKFIMNQESEI